MEGLRWGFTWTIQALKEEGKREGEGEGEGEGGRKVHLCCHCRDRERK